MRKFITAAVILCCIISISGCKSKTKEVSTDPMAIPKESDREMYERAAKYLKKKSEKARLLFKEIMHIYPESIYARRAKIGIADSYYYQKDAASLLIAASEYQEYVSLYPNSPDSVYAKFQIGMCSYKQIRAPGRDQTNTFKAIKAFENLIRQYPDTKKAGEAKEMIKKLRLNLAQHYYRIGYYNYKFKAFKGGIERFKQVMDEYPEFQRNDKLFYFTGKCYLAMYDFDSALSFFQKVIDSYPKSKYAKKARKNIKTISQIDREEFLRKQQEKMEKFRRKIEKRSKKKR